MDIWTDKTRIIFPNNYLQNKKFKYNINQGIAPFDM